MHKLSSTEQDRDVSLTGNLGYLGGTYTPQGTQSVHC